MVEKQHPGSSDFLDLWSAVEKIEGWLPFPDAYVIWSINEWQRQRGTTGDILEIGVYKGQSSTLFGGLLSEEASEHLEVCDLFGGAADGPENEEEIRSQYADLTQTQFEQNYSTRHRTLPTIHRMSSKDLGPLLTDRSFRLMHIDGSHLYEPVREDLKLSKQVLDDGGVVILDDYCHAEHPEVAAAVWETVLHEGLRTIVSTDMKLYATWSEAFPVSELQEFLSSRNGFRSAHHEIDRSSLVHLRLEGWTHADSTCF